MTVLRLLSYNVRSLRDDADAVARVIHDARPHVVCVQEAPRLLRWRSRCAALARLSGLVVVTGGRTAAGNLVLCDIGVRSVHSADLLLSPRPGLHRRGAAVAVLGLASHEFAVVGTHLDLDATARADHAAELVARLPAAGVPSGVPLVVAGDINEEPGGDAWAVLAAGGTDAFAAAGANAATAPNGAAAAGEASGTDGRTFPVHDRQRRIDGIFAGPGFTVRSATVLDSPDVRRASDHHPVLAELELTT